MLPTPVADEAFDVHDFDFIFYSPASGPQTRTGPRGHSKALWPTLLSTRPGAPALHEPGDFRTSWGVATDSTPPDTEVYFRLYRRRQVDRQSLPPLVVAGGKLTGAQTEAPFSGFQFNLSLRPTEAGQLLLLCQQHGSSVPAFPNGGSLQDCLEWYRQLKECLV